MNLELNPRNTHAATLAGLDDGVRRLLNLSQPFHTFP
jgi:hypothetical protein